MEYRSVRRILQVLTGLLCISFVALAGCGDSDDDGETNGDNGEEWSRMYEVTNHTIQPWTEETPEAEWCDDSAQEPAPVPDEFLQVEHVNLGTDAPNYYYDIDACESAEGAECTFVSQFRAYGDPSSLTADVTTGHQFSESVCTYFRQTDKLDIANEVRIELEFQRDVYLHDPGEESCPMAAPEDAEFECGYREYMTATLID